VFSDLPACPYARSALINEEVYFWHGNGDLVFDSLREMAVAMPGWQFKMALVYWEKPIGSDALWAGADEFNNLWNQYAAFVLDPQNWHPPQNAPIAPPPCEIITVQWQADLDTVRPNLLLSGYYNHFSEEDFAAIDYTQMIYPKY
jgi:hypothetical protein